ncbi:MAG: Crp/Fnr family transcriptional regulator [Bacteroidota bacterium]
MEASAALTLFPDLARVTQLAQDIISTCSIHTFSKGDIILTEGGYVHHIPMVVKGLVKVYKEDGEGNELLLYYIQKGESCIMSATSCVQNERSSVKAVIEEDAEILLIPAEKALAYGRDYPIWNTFFFGLFNQKYEELLHVIGILTFSNKETRLIEHLKKTAKLTGSQTLTLTHQNIADDLGSSREVISRLLKKLEKEEVLQLGHGQITLLS